MKNKLRSFFTDYALWAYTFISGLLVFSKINIFLLLVLAFFPPLIFSNANSVGRKAFPSKKKINGSLWKIQTILLVAVSLVASWKIVQVDLHSLFTKVPNTWHIVKGLFTPSGEYLHDALFALLETIYLAFLATLGAVPFAFVLSFFAARNLMPETFTGNLFYYTIRTFATIIRSIEALVWAIIFSVWVGIGPFAGMLALLVHSIASLVKLYSEQIENIDQGPVEAIKASGANTLQVWIYAVIPQILSPYLAFTIYRWDINVRMATIVGFVGGGGIGLLLQQQQMLLRWRDVGLIVWLIALIVWIMDVFSGYLRKRLV